MTVSEDGPCGGTRTSETFQKKGVEIPVRSEVGNVADRLPAATVTGMPNIETDRCEPRTTAVQLGPGIPPAITKRVNDDGLLVPSDWSPTWNAREAEPAMSRGGAPSKSSTTDRPWERSLTVTSFSGAKPMEEFARMSVARGRPLP